MLWLPRTRKTFPKHPSFARWKLDRASKSVKFLVDNFPIMLPAVSGPRGRSATEVPLHRGALAPHEGDCRTRSHQKARTRSEEHALRCSRPPDILGAPHGPFSALARLLSQRRRSPDPSSHPVASASRSVRSTSTPTRGSGSGRRAGPSSKKRSRSASISRTRRWARGCFPDWKPSSETSRRQQAGLSRHWCSDRPEQW